MPLLDRLSRVQRLGLLVLLLHLIGIIGAMTELCPLIVPLTPVHLLVTTVLLLAGAILDRWSIAVVLVVVLLGFAVEVAGVHTGRIFGSYAYGEVLGPKLFEVPVVIGLNWTLLVVAIGGSVERLQLPVMVKVLIATTAIVGLDVLIEPVAIAMDFWSWEGAIVPMQNYLGWAVVSSAFFLLFFRTPMDRHFPMAPWVLAAQLMFFVALGLNPPVC
ncbi:MAG: carotenoid biosynthesis protein [Flavobacteriales bacterium]|nr:carotenoid biosynthesis protein [Flavobacteriales bacterium]